MTCTLNSENQIVTSSLPLIGRQLGRQRAPCCLRAIDFLPAHPIDPQPTTQPQPRPPDVHGLIQSLVCTYISYLRLVDKFNEQNVSAFLTAGGAKLMLLHDGRTDDAIRTFFAEVHELYVKVRMSVCGCVSCYCFRFRDTPFFGGVLSSGRKRRSHVAKLCWLTRHSSICYSRSSGDPAFAQTSSLTPCRFDPRLLCVVIGCLPLLCSLAIRPFIPRPRCALLLPSASLSF